MKYATLITIIALAVIASGYAVMDRIDTAPKAGGYLPSTVTNTSSSIGMVDTIVYNATSGLQRWIGANNGAGQIFCSFTTTSTASAALNTGMLIQPPATTSTIIERDITDPVLLGKYMHCIANTTTSITQTKYGNY